MTINEINLRPIKSGDEEFLYQVYAGVRQDEMSIVGWTRAQIENFLRMQFNFQHKYYMQNYAGSAFDIILHNDIPVGRLYVARWEKEIRVIDIALLPQYRRQAIGSTLLNNIMAEAAKDHKSLSIHVERNNPALSLYHRLGFTKIGDNGVYFLMEWKKTSG